MDSLKCLGVAIVVVVGEVLLFAAYIVNSTGSTASLVAIG
jgi:hypothetical protein